MDIPPPPSPLGDFIISMSDTVGDDNFAGKVEWLKMHGVSGNENILGMIGGEAAYRDEIRREL